MFRKSFNFIFKIYGRYFQDDILAYSSQLAYNFLLAFFPFLIFIVSLTNNLGISRDLFYYVLKNLLPENAYALVQNVLSEEIYPNHSTLISVTIVLTLWTASVGFSGVIKGINRAYNIKENRPLWKLQIINILYTICLALGIVFTMVLLIYGSIENKILINKTGYEFFFSFGWKIIRYGLVGAFLILIFASVYRYAPCIRLSFKEVLPGAVFAVIAWLVASVGFSYYADNFARYSSLYGSITAVIVLMIWLFVSSNIILIGGEINGVLRELQQNKRQGVSK